MTGDSYDNALAETVIVLPLILAAPRWSEVKELINNQYVKEIQIRDALPFFALLFYKQACDAVIQS